MSKAVEPIEEYGLSKKHKTKSLFSKIGVVGCGKIGQNIARIASFHGIEVVFVEINETKIKEAKDGISVVLERRIENWGLTPGEKKAILARIKGTTDYKDLEDCDFVIESIRSDSNFDRTSTRKDVFRKIEAVVSKECIIATNATTIAITELASELIHKDRCVSLHFFVQSHEARVCEVVKSLYTTDEVHDKVALFVKLVKREVIDVVESAGLVSIRMFCTLLNEACETLMEGVTSIPQIDKTMQTGFGMRFGPFELADILGLDKMVRYMENLHEEFGKSKYKASPILMRLVRAKRYGKDSGIGFYEYDANGKINRANYFKQQL